jgi:hypothetical protein
VEATGLLKVVCPAIVNWPGNEHGKSERSLAKLGAPCPRKDQAAAKQAQPHSVAATTHPAFLRVGLKLVISLALKFLLYALQLWELLMRTQFLMTEADKCRLYAADLDGKTVASVLLRIAAYFEALAAQSAAQLAVPDAPPSHSRAR